MSIRKAKSKPNNVLEIPVTDNDPKKRCSGNSISGRSAAHYFSHDQSLAQLLQCHGIKVPDFILVPFLSDQGPLSINQLARIMSVEPRDLLASVKRLAAASLQIRDPILADPDSESTIRLTSRGQDVAARIDKQMR